VAVAARAARSRMMRRTEGLGWLQVVDSDDFKWSTRTTRTTTRTTRRNRLRRVGKLGDVGDSDRGRRGTRGLGDGRGLAASRWGGGAEALSFYGAGAVVRSRSPVPGRVMTVTVITFASESSRRPGAQSVLEGFK
jgi:hypothetical protein